MPNILLVYRSRNYGRPGSATLGLGVNAMHTVACLRAAGYQCSAVGVWEEKEIQIPPGVTHCIIEAPWVSLPGTLELCVANPSCKVYVRCHSNLAFLQVEPGSVNLMREILLYSETVRNLNLSTNSLLMRAFFDSTYHAGATYLPNLYAQERTSLKPRSLPATTLKAGSFGAIRLQKNHITGAAAALTLARKLGLSLEFHLMLDGSGAGAAEVVQAIGNLFTGLWWAKLVTHNWASWPLFRRVVMEMDLAFHLTASETFSLSTADCLAEGVPVVASPVVAWLPRSWLVPNTDDPGVAASIGERLLHDPQASRTGLAALASACSANLDAWESELAQRPS